MTATPTDNNTSDSSHPPSRKRRKTYRDYTFYRYEQVEEKWLSPTMDLAPETLCWVQQSRGKKRKSSKQLYERAWVVTGEKKIDKGDDEPRLMVRYPKGSTYHVRRSNLLPVLQEEHMVIVLPETNFYRKWATVHTRPNDHFVEIGCDIGILVQKVWECSSCPEYVSGIDKAEEDIAEAKKRYPGCNFHAWSVPLGDQFEEEDATTPRKWAYPPLPTDLFPPIHPDATMNSNLVVAVDINGTRALQAVKQCVQIVIEEWKPRLIVVKSRTLYADLAEKNGEERVVGTDATS